MTTVELFMHLFWTEKVGLAYQIHNDQSYGGENCLCLPCEVSRLVVKRGGISTVRNAMINATSTPKQIMIIRSDPKR